MGHLNPIVSPKARTLVLKAYFILKLFRLGLLPKHLTHLIVASLMSTPRKPGQSLTKREHEVLQLIWLGLTNQEIARHLNIKFKTVEAHRASLRSKLGASNTAQLIQTALKEGLIHPPPE